MYIYVVKRENKVLNFGIIRHNFNHIAYKSYYDFRFFWLQAMFPDLSVGDIKSKILSENDVEIEISMQLPSYECELLQRLVAKMLTFLTGKNLNSGELIDKSHCNASLCHILKSNLFLSSHRLYETEMELLLELFSPYPFY